MKHLVTFLFCFCLCPAHAQPKNPVSQSLLPGGADKWELVWNDEFDYPNRMLEEKWISQNSSSTHILSSRWRENAVVSNGLLRLVNKKEKRGGNDWTSGNVWTKTKFQYGYFECRYRYAAAEGTNNSFWLMTTGKPPAGMKSFEIDINEGHYPNKVNTNIHNHSDTIVVNGKKTHPTSSRKFLNDDEVPWLDDSNRASTSSPGTRKPKPGFVPGFQTYGLEWTQSQLVFYVNGRKIRSEKNVFCHSPSPVWLSLAVIPWAGKITDAIDGTAMEVDYVRIYRNRK